MDNLAPDIKSTEKYDPLLYIANQNDADRYFERVVEHTMRTRKVPRDVAEQFERQYIHHYSLHFSEEVRNRLLPLFKATYADLYSGNHGGDS
jgi:hypothetical protein